MSILIRLQKLYEFNYVLIFRTLHRSSTAGDSNAVHCFFVWICQSHGSICCVCPPKLWNCLISPMGGSMVFWNFVFERFLGIFWDVEIPQARTNDTCSKKFLWSELLCGLVACGYGNCFKRGYSGSPISFCKQWVAMNFRLARMDIHTLQFSATRTSYAHVHFTQNSSAHAPAGLVIFISF